SQRCRWVQRVASRATSYGGLSTAGHPMPWVEKRRRSDRPDDSGDIPGEKRAALVGCRRSGYALSPAAHPPILICADDLPVGKGMAPVRCASPHPSTYATTGVGSLVLERGKHPRLVAFRRSLFLRYLSAHR